jgi:hypothetical protein
VKCQVGMFERVDFAVPERWRKVRNRRIFLLTTGSGEGPLTDSTTAVRRRQRDRRRHLGRPFSALDIYLAVMTRWAAAADVVCRASAAPL